MENLLTTAICFSAEIQAGLDGVSVVGNKGIREVCNPLNGGIAIFGTGSCSREDLFVAIW